jgi:hypothetical protein
MFVYVNTCICIIFVYVNTCILYMYYICVHFLCDLDLLNGTITGADSGGAHPARAPPKIGKNMIFLA